MRGGGVLATALPAAILITLASGGTGAPAQEAAPADANVPLVVSAALDTTATVIGGRLRLDLGIEAAEGWMVVPPAEDLDVGPFALRRIELVREADGRPAGFRLTLVPLEVGDLEVPSIRIEARGPEGETLAAETAPLPVQVASNFAPPAVDEPATDEPATDEPATDGEGGAAGSAAAPAPPEPVDLKPALEAPRDWRPVWIALAALVVSSVLGFLLLRRLRRLRGRSVEKVPARRKVRERPAWEVALEELDRIVAAGHVDRGEIDRQYVEDTLALRRYLEDRYGVPALECTTSELRALLDRVTLPPEARARALALLEEADLVKFAKARPETAAARETEPRARALVTETMPRPAAPDAAPDAAGGGAS